MMVNDLLALGCAAKKAVFTAAISKSFVVLGIDKPEIVLSVSEG